MKKKNLKSRKTTSSSGKVIVRASEKNPYWLVLDVHGVLIKSSEKWILGRLARKTGRGVLPLYVHWFLNTHDAQRGKLSAKQFYERVLGQRLSDREFDEWIMKPYSTRGMIPADILDALKKLKEKGWKLAILSDMNTAQAAFHRNAKHFAIFDEVFISSETGLMKPFPSVYAALEKRLKTRKDHIVFGDDLWPNTLSASLHGWKAVTLNGHAGLRQLLRELG